MIYLYVFGFIAVAFSILFIAYKFQKFKANAAESKAAAATQRADVAETVIAQQDRTVKAVAKAKQEAQVQEVAEQAKIQAGVDDFMEKDTF